jgi:hypothetical protein
MSFTLNQLTEGIRQRHMGAQHTRLVEKWNRTGLLRGLEGNGRENMAVMLENQAAQLLREVNTLGSTTSAGSQSGDIRGFQNIAFPIVRRVFGGLVANELVSIQPMSLPSGLLFYLDYTYGTAVGGADADNDASDSADRSTYKPGSSIYNNPAGKGVQSGSLAAGGQYDLAGAGYSRRHGTASTSNVLATADQIRFGLFNDSGNFEPGNLISSAGMLTGASGRHMQFDPQITRYLEDGTWNWAGFAMIPAKYLTGSGRSADLTLIKDVALYTTGTVGWTDDDYISEAIQGGQKLLNVRRLNKLGTYAGGTGKFTDNPLLTTSDANACVLVVLGGDTAASSVTVPTDADTMGFDFSFALAAGLNVDSTVGDALTIPTFESDFGGSGSPGNPSPVIPEIDIKIESLAVTAVTRKLRARWSPELAQDLNAYHSLDAEVELTQILSEQIALELDREILNDLLTQANGSNLYWSRMPGKFLNKLTGVEVARTSSLRPGPAFTGTVREWYETLTETIIDCANTIHRKTLRGSANFIVVGPDVATILESSVLYKPVYSIDGDGQAGSPMTIGAEKVGSLSNRFTVYKDPYFPRNKILVGYKGGSYLETGYVYAPYVPLIVTPTIFAPEDFTPRKGVMTRYGKKMVRSDFYGTVTVLDLNII